MFRMGHPKSTATFVDKTLSQRDSVVGRYVTAIHSVWEKLVERFKQINLLSDHLLIDSSACVHLTFERDAFEDHLYQAEIQGVREDWKGKEPKGCFHCSRGEVPIGPICDRIFRLRCCGLVALASLFPTHRLPACSCVRQCRSSAQPSEFDQFCTKQFGQPQMF